MKFNIVCIGKIKESYIKEGIALFVKRMERFAVVNEVELPESLLSPTNAENMVLENESARLIAAAKGYKIVLDIDGVNLGSVELARKMDKLATDGHSEISFIIGGSLGITEDVKRRCDFRLSFGKMTYPHQLMRLLLCEQLYRAISINNNLPYHK